MHRLGSSSRSLKVSCSSILDSQSLSLKLRSTRPISDYAAKTDSGRNPSKVRKLGPNSHSTKKSAATELKTPSHDNAATLGGRSSTEVGLKRLESQDRIQKAFLPSAKGKIQHRIYKKDEDVPLGSSAPVEDDSLQVKLTPGTFVELRRNETRDYGVFLTEFHEDRYPRIFVLLASGEISSRGHSDVVFTVPAVASPDLAARCVDVYDIENQDPIIHNARVEVLKRIRNVVRQVESRYREVCNRGINLYERFRSNDPKKSATFTLQEAAKLINPKPDFITLFATHQFLLEQPACFTIDRSYVLNQQLHVRALAELEILEKVKEWVRLPIGKGPIDSFAEKVKEVIAINQQIPRANDDIPSRVPALHAWNETDKTIIQFLMRSIQTFRSTQVNPYRFPMSTICRRVLPSSSVISEDTVHRLLVDIGVFAPWQDTTIIKAELNLDPDPPHKSTTAQAKDALVQRGFSTPASTKVLGPKDFYPLDPLESVRHDFGDLPVYVIDDASAEELDDGISVERIPTEPGNLWIHTHVANPGSLIHPGNELAQYARKQEQTIYLAQRSFPLFPKSLMHDPGRGLSLGSQTSKGCPERVLTFSSKVDSRGNILDYKVRAGLVNNVNILTYEQVEFHIRGKVMEKHYPFESPPSKDTYKPLSKRQEEDMRLLDELVNSLLKDRYDKGEFTSYIASAAVSRLNIPHELSLPTLEPSVFRGFPKYVYEVDEPRRLMTGARGIVSECMKLACRVASRYGVDHNLPLIRRASEPWVYNTEEDHPKLLSLRDSLGYIPMHDALPFFVVVPTAEYTLEPKGHKALGIPDGEGYSRVTSPLRRFADLLLHWQIQHSLLGSHAPSSKPPFSRAFLEEYASNLKLKDSAVKYASGENNLFYCLKYIERWMQETERLKSQGKEREHDPLRDLEAIITMVKGPNRTDGCNQHRVWIPQIGTYAVMKTPPCSDDIEFGTRVPVQIESVAYSPSPVIVVTPRK